MIMPFLILINKSITILMAPTINVAEWNRRVVLMIQFSDSQQPSSEAP